jgi:hypothetical protein
MKVKIIIECEDEQELLSHLFVIRRDLKRELKKDPEFEGHLEDNNCYGWHNILVKDNK